MGTQGESDRQQQDIEALARRNAELVGVRASLARRLKVAEDNLSQVRNKRHARICLRVRARLASLIQDGGRVMNAGAH